MKAMPIPGHQAVYRYSQRVPASNSEAQTPLMHPPLLPVQCCLVLLLSFPPGYHCQQPQDRPGLAHASVAAVRGREWTDEKRMTLTVRLEEEDEDSITAVPMTTGCGHSNSTTRDSPSTGA